MALRLPRWRELFLNKKFEISSFGFSTPKKVVPRGFAARSLARSLAVRFTRPNKRACSQAKYEPLIVSIEPEGIRELFRTGSKQLESDYFMKQLCEFFFLYWLRGTGSVLCRIALLGLLGRCDFFYWLLRRRAGN